MAVLTRAIFEQITASAEFRRVQGTSNVISVFRQADVKEKMLATFTNLQGVDANGRPKYEKFLRLIERTYTNELLDKIGSYGP